ncbi:MAG: hypothetical protein IID08_01180 [Candidatus Hydrogenedentes bacterium]|nr:hypothetical protein [Candidatus Hydrogenedentota bacterium]
MSIQKKTRTFRAFPFRKAFIIPIALIACLSYGGLAFPQKAKPEKQSTRKDVRELKSLVTDLQLRMEEQNEVIQQLQRERESGRKVEAPVSGHEGHAGHDADLKSDDGFSDKFKLRLGNDHEIDVSAVLDFTFFSTDNKDDSRRSKFDLREIEIGFQGQVTDTARVDLFLTKPVEEEFEIEEGFLTLELGRGFKVKAGKYRLEFGKLNTVHETARPSVNLPLPLLNFLGDDQLNDTGVTVGHLIPNPWEHEIGLSVTLSNGDNETSFDGASTDPLISARLYDLMPVGQSSDFEIGLNVATGENGTGASNRTTLGLLDLTYRFNSDYKPNYDYPARFMWQTEAIASKRETVTGDVDSFGAYTLLDYQFIPAWHLGFRYDYSETPESTQSEEAFSTILTWYYTKHSKFRLQYEYYESQLGEPENRIWLQSVIILGRHEHPKFLKK